jgi:hypothetical protein
VLLLGDGDPVGVIFANEEDGETVDSGKVEPLMEGPVIARTVAKEAGRYLIGFSHLR